MTAPLVAALRSSARVTGRLMSVTLAGLTVLIVVVVVAGLVARGDATVAFYDYAGGPFSGVMSVASAFMLVCSGFGLLLVALWEAARHRTDPVAGRWTAAGLLVVYLACDELLGLHERYTEWLTAWGAPSIAGVDRDLYVWGVYLVLAIVIVWRIAPEFVRLVTPLAPLALAVFLLVVSQIADFIPWDSLGRDARNVVGPVEEGTKTLGVAMLLVAVVAIHQQLWRMPLEQTADPVVADAGAARTS